ncbi:hypothetical protein A5782_05665 [Mycobacterium sp. 852002-40037_SCH5390672]|nr:hypothetical protein A5782_05665 [Mycobacterium sp. 852002-40037_SCH5390672]
MFSDVRYPRFAGLVLKSDKKVGIHAARLIEPRYVAENPFWNRISQPEFSGATCSDLNVNQNDQHDRFAAQIRNVDSGAEMLVTGSTCGRPINLHETCLR